MRSQVLRSSPARSTSSGDRSALAPLTIRMEFSPEGSTMMGATPLERPATFSTCRVSTPKRRRLATVPSPNMSSPTLVTIRTSAPSFAAATAWLAPLPPWPISKEGASTVSPRSGIRVT